MPGTKTQHGLNIIPAGTRNWADLANGNTETVEKYMESNDTRLDELAASNEQTFKEIRQDSVTNNTLQGNQNRIFDERINGIVSQAGDDNTEIVDARYSYLLNKQYPTLSGRLAEIELKMADLNCEVGELDQHGSYTKAAYTRLDGSVYLISTLSEIDDDYNYRRMTFNYYDNFGQNIILTRIWDLSYDAYGKLVKWEVVQ